MPNTKISKQLSTCVQEVIYRASRSSWNAFALYLWRVADSETLDNWVRLRVQVLYGQETISTGVPVYKVCEDYAIKKISNKKFHCPCYWAPILAAGVGTVHHRWPWLQGYEDFDKPYFGYLRGVWQGLRGPSNNKPHQVNLAYKRRCDSVADDN